MYTGKLILNNQEIDRMFDFMSIAKSLELQILSEEITLVLIKKSNTRKCCVNIRKS